MMTLKKQLEPSISVIIVNYNAGEKLHKTLHNLRLQTYRQFEVIVFDNASLENPIDNIEEEFSEYLIIRHTENIGFAAGNNKAVKSAKGSWLAFLNPDAYPETDWLWELDKARETYPDIRAFGSTQISAVDRNSIDGAGDTFHILGLPYRCLFGQPISRLPRDDIEAFSACAAAAFYERATFDRLGGFDESLFCYTEDVDLGFRHRLEGGRTIQLRRAIVYHEGSGVTGRFSDFTIYHGNRNRIWVSYTNMPGAYLWLLLPLQMLFNILFIPRAFKRGYGPTYLKALKDGYFMLPHLNKKRALIQQSSVVPGWRLIKSMTWSPLKLLSRRG